MKVSSGVPLEAYQLPDVYIPVHHFLSHAGFVFIHIAEQAPVSHSRLSVPPPSSDCGRDCVFPAPEAPWSLPSRPAVLGRASPARPSRYNRTPAGLQPLFPAVFHSFSFSDHISFWLKTFGRLLNIFKRNYFIFSALLHLIRPFRV